ncbi:MAG: hypothetical protein HOK28_16000 [Deltaproteobacteria bacterium]|jgi:hypothetical protein|nr:hypothetical protein [Deltaproteobacteria bacterium]
MTPRIRTIKIQCLCLGIGIIMGLGAAPAHAGYFEEGTTRASLGFGTGSFGVERYFILGPGVGFFVMDGLELELGAEIWLGADPSLFVLSPGVRYTVTQLGEFMPYVGGFYKHAFIKGVDDKDILGARLGISWDLAANLIASGGAVFEYDLGCESIPELNVKCSRWLPEVGLALLF